MRPARPEGGRGEIEYKSLRTRRELATTPAWVLGRGIEMAKTENRRPKLALYDFFADIGSLYTLYAARARSKTLSPYRSTCY